MATLGDYGGLLLASRLKRLSESLYAGVDEVYREEGVKLSSRCFPVLFLLRDNGPMGITALAAQLGQSHPAVIQMSRKLLAERVVAERTDPADERRRILALTAKGRDLMKRLEPVWEDIQAAAKALAPEPDLVAALAGAESALAERGFAERIRAGGRARAAQEAEIIPFEPRYREDFKRLNLEWLEKFFHVEPIDQDVLSHPEERILQPGGRILLARLGGEIVGTCALIKAGRSRFELSKMAVTERCQGLGLGKKLLLAGIEAFKASGAKELFLETSSRLGPAVRMYEQYGFVHAPRPKGASHYQRADVYMVYRG
ncbi:MAG TPA: bifunctional helix-turn-helix transcriptional regulator/GNAT family N-acetyltransferase [Holophagaceae bacterium]|nr:bifunctional helix-turn-helix transcriptional regulator/GNAT family N-acetyltransferase [Holophagaceae bacterium]